MTKIVHDAFVELFRSDAGLLKEIIGERYGLDDLEPEQLSAELTLPPSEYRADSIVVFKDERGAARLAVVVEVQHTLDYRKRFTWPVYLAATRAREECPTLLFVLAKDEEIAAFARASIDLGHPSFQLTPLVITAEQIPRVEDVESARRLPRLAVLSALTHQSYAIAAAALAVLDGVSEAYVQIYRDVIISKFPKPEQAVLEAQMEEYYEWKSELAKRQIAELKEASRVEGRRQGWILAQQDTAVRLARLNLGQLTDEQEAKIRQLVDEESLFQLILRLARVAPEERASDVLAELG